MKCMKKQNKCKSNLGCPISQDSIVECEFQQCYAVWNNVTGYVAIQEQGCFSGSQECSLHKECLGTRRGHDYFCCCSEDFCNWIVVNRPRMAKEQAGSKYTLQNPATTATHLVQLIDSNTTVSRGSMISIIPLLVPVLGIILCFTLVAYLWQRHYFHEKMIREFFMEKKRKHEKRFLLSKCLMGSCTNVDNRECGKSEATKHRNVKRGRSSDTGCRDKVTMLCLKGRGTFGAVWVAMLRQKTVAVKVFGAAEKDSFENEMRFYQLPNVNNHCNLLRFIGNNEPLTKQNPGDMYIVLEYHDIGSLNNYLTENVLQWLQVLQIAEGIASGLAFLHEAIPGDEDTTMKPPVAHRDLKTKNILLKNDLTPCIADFGLAHIFVEYDNVHVTEKFCQVGTLRYMAPEVLDRATNMDTQAFISVDMYAFGLVLWEVLSRCSFYGAEVDEYRAPFLVEVGSAPSMASMYEAVCKKKLRPIMKAEWMTYPNVSFFCETISDCWDHDPDARISAGCVEERLIQIQNGFSVKSEINEVPSLLSGTLAQKDIESVEICHSLNDSVQMNTSQSNESSKLNTASSSVETTDVKLHSCPSEVVSNTSVHSDDLMMENSTKIKEKDINVYSRGEYTLNLSKSTDFEILSCPNISTFQMYDGIDENNNSEYFGYHDGLNSDVEKSDLDVVHDKNAVVDKDCEGLHTNEPIPHVQIDVHKCTSYCKLKSRTLNDSHLYRETSDMPQFHGLEMIGAKCLSPCSSSGYGSFAFSDHLDLSREDEGAKPLLYENSSNCSPVNYEEPAKIDVMHQNIDKMVDIKENKSHSHFKASQKSTLAFSVVYPSDSCLEKLERKYSNYKEFSHDLDDEDKTKDNKSVPKVVFISDITSKASVTAFDKTNELVASESCLNHMERKLKNPAYHKDFSLSSSVKKKLNKGLQNQSSIKVAFSSKPAVSSFETTHEIDDSRSSLDLANQLRRPSLNTDYGSCISDSSTYLSCNENIN